MDVRSGHRITLTCNLYVHERLGVIVSRNTSIRPDHHVLHNHVINVLESPDFMAKGGTLRLYCQYAYSHTNKDHNARLPYALEEFDAMSYSICYYMGLDVKVRPVMKGLPEYYYLDHLEQEHPALRKNLQDGTKVVCTELHSLTISDASGCGDEDSATIICRMHSICPGTR